jgi:hypothetical protein
LYPRFAQLGINRGYRPDQLITQFMRSVRYCANRFEHGEVTRHDPVLERLFGFKRFANFKAEVQHTSQTLRYQLVAKPSYITTESQKHILNLALAMQVWRKSVRFSSQIYADLYALVTL